MSHERVFVTGNRLCGRVRRSCASADNFRQHQHYGSVLMILVSTSTVKVLVLAITMSTSTKKSSAIALGSYEPNR